MIHRGLAGMFTAMLLSACHLHQHVVLRVPDRDATLASRIAAYEALAPKKNYVRKVVVGFSLTHGVRTERYTGLRLMNGVGLECPRDLLQVVEFDSVVGRAARAWDRHDWLGDILGWGVALPLGSVSFGMLFAGAAGRDETMATLGGVGLGFSLGVAITSIVFYALAAAEKRRALSPELYDAALMERLGLCTDRDKHGACD